VRLTVSDRMLDIDVTNPMADPPSGPRAQVDRPRRGLPGIRERVALLGGRMRVDRSGGEWRLSVELPTGGVSTRRA
jgi:signal transduction histidine kinase